MKRLIAIALIVGAGAPAMASEWIGIAWDDSNWHWLVENSTIDRRSDGSKTVWVRIDHSADKGERAHESRGMMVLWCGSRRYSWESLMAFAANGHEIPRWTRVSPPDNVAPDTAIEKIYNWVCGGTGN